LRLLTAEITDLIAEITDRVTAIACSLLAIVGCGQRHRTITSVVIDQTTASPVVHRESPTKCGCTVSP
jgi:hypothetical protein